MCVYQCLHYGKKSKNAVYPRKMETEFLETKVTQLERCISILKLLVKEKVNIVSKLALFI